MKHYKEFTKSELKLPFFGQELIIINSIGLSFILNAYTKHFLFADSICDLRLTWIHLPWPVVPPWTDLKPLGLTHYFLGQSFIVITTFIRDDFPSYLLYTFRSLNPYC
jgi:hypothetical protein